MKRKVIKQGKSTLTISLPSKLVQKFGIAEGDEVEIEDRDGELVINPHKAPRKVTVELAVDGFNSSLFWRCINALYTRGVDEIVLTFNDDAALALAHEVPGQLLGFAIVKEDNNSCVLKEIAEIKEEEFETMQRHLFFTLMAMSRDVLRGLKNNDKEILDGVKSRERELNTLTLFCLRILNKKGYKDLKKVSPICSIIISLEHIGDALNHIARDIELAKAPGDLTRALERIDKLLEGFYFAFYKNDLEKIKLLHEQNKQLDQDLKEFKPKSKEETAFFYEIRRMIDAIKHIIESELALLL